MGTSTMTTQLVLRWIGIIPGALLCAFLADFPIHWAVMLVGYLGTEHDNNSIVYTDPIAAIPPEVLELFGNAFFTPFVIISVGARIAPRHKFHTGIALAIILGVIYGVVSTWVARDISEGVYTAGRWIRLGITILLCISGLIAGLYVARRQDPTIEIKAQSNLAGAP
jgi:hypothetical protein